MANMTRGPRIAASVLVAWVVWMVAKALMPETYALLLFPATGVAVWLLTGAVAARRAAADEDYEVEDDADQPGGQIRS